MYMHAKNPEFVCFHFKYLQIFKPMTYKIGTCRLLSCHTALIGTALTGHDKGNVTELGYEVTVLAAWSPNAAAL